MKWTWDRSVGSPMDADGNAPPVMWIKYLLKWRGWSFDLHKMIGADAPNCFHTHPYNAWRFCFWGGYDEQVELKSGSTLYVAITSPYIGRVAHDLCHRVAALHNGRVSYSLWLHGPCIHRIEFRGAGWGGWRTDV